MPTTINGKLLNTNKHVFFFFFFSLSVSLAIWQPLSPSSHYKSQIKTQIQKNSFLPRRWLNSGDGRGVLTSARKCLSASCCELNRCEESTLFTQRGGWQGRGIPAGDDCQGSRKPQICLQPPITAVRAANNLFFFDNHTNSSNAFF